jgi:hypothetical protein
VVSTVLRLPVKHLADIQKARGSGPGFAHMPQIARGFPIWSLRVRRVTQRRPGGRTPSRRLDELDAGTWSVRARLTRAVEEWAHRHTRLLTPSLPSAYCARAG